MKIALDWLREFVEVAIAPRELGDRLSMAGFELESLAAAAPPFFGVVVAEIVSAERHPQADKLQVCQVSIGTGAPLQIVCGASNARAGLRTALATVGALLPGELTIKAAKLRGVESAGMLCSAKELGLAEVSEGIVELPPDAPLGADLRSVLGLDESVLEIAITPNRGDAMSVLGVAREVAAITGAPLRKPSGAETSDVAIDPTVDAAFGSRARVTLAAPDACPQFHARVVVDIDNARPTPLWMRERLRRAGQRSISPVVDVTNYIVLELGQPMHAYDLDRLQGNITVRHARAGEPCELLDGRTVELGADVLAIADEAGAVAMAGVMGGMRTSVTPQTRRVLFEVAWFAPRAIAGRGRRYGLVTDASQRFERGVDPHVGARAIERATRLLLQIAGGRAGAVHTTRSGQLRPVATVALRASQLRRVLGYEISSAEVTRILTSLGMSCATAADVISVTPPSHRFDIAIERDLIEEVARIAGYDAAPVTVATAAQPIVARPSALIEEQRVLDTLAARGWNEGVHFAFVDPALQETLFPGVAVQRVVNPIASDLAVMRVSLWPGLIRALQENQRRQQTRVRLFEHGVVFPVGAPESDRIAGLASGTRHPEQWGEARAALDFYDVRADLEALLSLAGERFEFRVPADPQCLHPGRSAEILRAGVRIGLIGELHPNVSRSLELNGGVVVFEIDYAAAFAVRRPTFSEVSRFPQVRRDLAVVVDESIEFAALRECVHAAAGASLRELVAFDVYRGSGIESSRKSVGLGLILQEKDRTLTDDETDRVMTAVRVALTRGFGATFRE